MQSSLMKVLLLCLLGHLLIANSRAASNVPKSGYSQCKCANFTAHQSELPELGLSSNEMSSYGFGCAPHDVNTSVCKELDDISEECRSIFPVPSRCKNEIPTWCSYSWCYIADETECDVPYSESIYFEDTYFSYAACGERDNFSSNPLENALKGTVLNAAYRVNSGGWLGSYHPEGYKNQVPMIRDDQWFGIMPKFIDEFAISAGADINMTEAPLWVYDVANFSSDFTNCVHAVSLGMLDFCAGMFSITTQRAMMTSFFTIETTPMFLVVKEEDEIPFSDRIFRAFEPFTLGAWVCTLLISVTSTFILVYQESVSGGINDAKKHGLKKKTCLQRFGKSIFLGFSNFLGGGITNEASTWQGRCTGITLGIFSLIIISMYTANLTTILVSRASRVMVTSIDDALSQNHDVCLIKSTKSLVEDLYPTAKWKVLDNRKDLIDSIEDRKCSCGIMYLEDLEVLHSDGKYCDLTPVGLPIVNIHRGIPLNPLKAKALNYHFHKLANNGAWNDLKQRGLVNRCFSDKTKQNTNSLQFGIIDLVGIFVLCSASTLFFGVLSIFRWHKRNKASNEVDTDVEEFSESKLIFHIGHS